MKVYNLELVETLRTLDINAVRRFAGKWGKIMANRALLNLAKAPDDFVAVRMRMMIVDRPDLADLHEEAERWLLDRRRPGRGQGNQS